MLVAVHFGPGKAVGTCKREQSISPLAANQFLVIRVGPRYCSGATVALVMLLLLPYVLIGH